MFKDLKLFQGLTEDEINIFLKNSKFKIEKFKKQSYIFRQGDRPEYLYILIKGIVSVERTEQNGKRIIVNQFRDENTVFGEVYLYVEKKEYDYSAVAIKDSEILMIPRKAMDFSSDSKLGRIVANNMLEILSNKAFYLNQKLLIFSSFSLRQKILKLFMLLSENSEKIELNLNREELADFLGVARPSISRELMSMQEDGLIKINRNKVQIDKEKIKNFI